MWPICQPFTGLIVVLCGCCVMWPRSCDLFVSPGLIVVLCRCCVMWPLCQTCPCLIVVLCRRCVMWPLCQTCPCLIVVLCGCCVMWPLCQPCPGLTVELCVCCIRWPRSCDVRQCSTGGGRRLPISSCRNTPGEVRESGQGGHLFTRSHHLWGGGSSVVYVV